MKLCLRCLWARKTDLRRLVQIVPTITGLCNPISILQSFIPRKRWKCRMHAATIWVIHMELPLFFDHGLVEGSRYAVSRMPRRSHQTVYFNRELADQFHPEREWSWELNITVSTPIFHVVHAACPVYTCIFASIIVMFESKNRCPHILKLLDWNGSRYMDQMGFIDQCQSWKWSFAKIVHIHEDR